MNAVRKPRALPADLPSLLRDTVDKMRAHLGQAYADQLREGIAALDALLAKGEAVTQAKDLYYHQTNDDAAHLALHAWADRVDDLTAAVNHVQGESP
jgi:hypothetical protein